MRAAAYATRVMAMAGIVRRTRALAATPTLNANTMHAAGTMPWVSYHALLYLPPNAATSGWSVHTVSSPSASAASASTEKTNTSFVVIQRSGLTDWLHARR